MGWLPREEMSAAISTNLRLKFWLAARSWSKACWLATLPVDIRMPIAAPMSRLVVHANLKHAALAHLPSGKFTATAAWLVLACSAFKPDRSRRGHQR